MSGGAHGGTVISDTDGEINGSLHTDYDFMWIFFTHCLVEHLRLMYTFVHQ